MKNTMKYSFHFLTFSSILTGCKVGLEIDEKLLEPLDSGLTETEPSSEPAFEPSQPSSEPSDDPNVDNDGDGLSVNQGDCDDSNAQISPFATEIPSDEIDQNCDGKELCYQDGDGDGFATTAIVLSADIFCGNEGDEAPAHSQTTDCNDNDANINPSMTEINGDGIDQNCDGSDEISSTGTDWDNDGYDSSVDCNDYDASVHPGATDIPNDGIDQDCNGSDTSTTGSGYIGTENFLFAEGQTSSGIYECNMNFSVSGTPSSIPCSSCDYAFDMTIIYDATTSTASTNCTNLTISPQHFSYGFSSNYNGVATLFLYAGSPYYTWQPWISSGTTNFNRVDSVSFSATSFSYHVGYVDYYVNNAYYWGYYTYYFSGSGTQ